MYVRECTCTNEYKFTSEKPLRNLFNQEIECGQLGMLINVIHNFLLAKLYETDRQFFKRIVVGSASYARLSKRPATLETLSEVCETAEEYSSSPGTASASVPMTDSMLLTGLANTDSVGAIDELTTAFASCTPCPPSSHRVYASASGDDNGGCEQVESGAPRRRSGGGGGGARVRCRSASEDSQEGADGGGAPEQRLYPRRPKIHVERARLERQSAVVGALHGSRSQRVPAAGASGGKMPASDASDEGETSFSSRSPSPVESDAEAHV